MRSAIGFMLLLSCASYGAVPTALLPKPINTCGCELTNGEAAFASSLWLDIVFVVDVSKAMGGDRLEKAAAMIEGIAYSLTVGKDAANAAKQKGRFSRVGIIAAADKPEMIPPLKPLNLSLTTADQADLGSAIQSAIRMISSAPSRSARQIIYIITASDSSETGRYVRQCEEKHDATCDVEKFKAKGGIIAVMEATSSLNVERFAKLASPGYYDTSFADDTNYYLKMLCFANCFCPRGLIPFSRPDALNRNAPDGGCFFSQSPAPYSTAKKMCQASGAQLATIHDLYKPFFLMQASRGKPTWIGGLLDGQQLEPLDENTAAYTNWAAGQPNPSRGSCAYSKQSSKYTSEWHSEDCSVAKKYMCEIRPCSVDNYCK